jgi:hypothetical protein
MSRFRTATATVLLGLGLVGGVVATAVPAATTVLASSTTRTVVGYYTAGGKLCIIYRVMYLDGPRAGETEIDTVCTDLRRLREPNA